MEKTNKNCSKTDAFKRCCLSKYVLQESKLKGINLIQRAVLSEMLWREFSHTASTINDKSKFSQQQEKSANRVN